MKTFRQFLKENFNLSTRLKAMANIREQGNMWLLDLPCDKYTFSGLFLFRDSKEGFAYWTGKDVEIRKKLGYVSMW